MSTANEENFFHTIKKTFDDQEIRIVQKDGQVWLVAQDVCEALGVANTTMALRRLDDDEKGVNTIEGKPNAAGEHLREVNVVNEPGVYRLIFTSRKDEAEEFKRWLAHDVLPTIRRTGTYSMDGTMGEGQLPDRFTVTFQNGKATDIRHRIEKGSVYARVQDVAEAAGYHPNFQKPHIYPGDAQKEMSAGKDIGLDNSHLWITRAGVSVWMARSTVKNAEKPSKGDPGVAQSLVEEVMPEHPVRDKEST